MSLLVNRLSALFERPGFIRWAYRFIIDVINEYETISKHHENKYKRVKQRTGSATDSSQEKPSLFGSALKWRRFPPQLRYVAIYSSIAIPWAVFAIVKLVLLRQFGKAIDQTRWLKLPLHCYLVGRFVLHEDFEQITAAMFSLGYLGWLATHALSKPFGNNTLSFLLIRQRDFRLVLAKLTTKGGLVLTTDQCNALSPSENFLLDMMSYSKPLTQGRLIYRLRPNRSDEARKSLCRCFARHFMAGSLLAGSVAVVLTILIVYLTFTSERYLRYYPNCDPELERLRELGEMPKLSIATSWHRFITWHADIMENFLVWTSCGFGCTYVSLLCGIQVFDLLTYWQIIDAKVKHLQKRAHLISGSINHFRPNDSEHARCLIRAAELSFSGRGRRMASSYVAEVRELIIQLGDFFKQMADANEYMSTAIDTAMLYCLILCGVYTYFLQVQGLGQVPITMILTFCYLGSCISFICATALILHRHCLRTLTSICSLMAEDPIKYNSPYEAVLEFFTRKRTCFTMFQRPFGATTFLTVVGWAFSCFFVITSLVQIASRKG